MKILALLTAAVLVFAATPTFANTAMPVFGPYANTAMPVFGPYANPVLPVSGTHDCNKNKAQDTNFHLSFDSNPVEKTVFRVKTQGIKN